MPITYQRDCDGYDLHVSFHDRVELRDIEDYFNGIMDEVDSFHDFRTLVDVSDAFFRGFSFTHVRRFAGLTQTFEARVKNSKTAVVAGSAVAYGLVRMYISIRNMDYDFAVFRDTEAALQWLRGAPSPST